MGRYFLQLAESGLRMPVGNPLGYGTVDEAVTDALRFVDDALPQNTVRVLQEIGYAFLAGDGSDAIKLYGQPTGATR